MPSVGRSHFDAYTEQNRVKHAILTKYLAAYLQSLGNTAEAFHYIDGFAGSGKYAGQHDGSPLVALTLLGRQSRPATASFVENDPRLFDQLELSVAKAAMGLQLFEPPMLKRGQFSEHISAVLRRNVYTKFRRVATFAFVDPCGVNGLYMSDLRSILAAAFGECLVFWNYDGLNRWLGGVVAGSHGRDQITALYGSANAADRALLCAASGANASEKERCLRDGYLQAVGEHSGAKFVLPFRFQANDKNRTSHYLIHLSMHARAFVIMKDVMKRESSASSDMGRFEFLPRSELGIQAEMFTPNAERAREEILGALRTGQRHVRLFTEEWIERPTDLLTARDYKTVLLALEGEGLIEVVDPGTSQVKGAPQRIRAGKVTLGDRYFVRLRPT